jgi:hypothetical protein
LRQSASSVTESVAPAETERDHFVVLTIAELRWKGESVFFHERRDQDNENGQKRRNQKETERNSAMMGAGNFASGHLAGTFTLRRSDGAVAYRLRGSLVFRRREHESISIQ